MCWLFQYHSVMVYWYQNKALQISATRPYCARQEDYSPITYRCCSLWCICVGYMITEAEEYDDCAVDDEDGVLEEGHVKDLFTCGSAASVPGRFPGRLF